MNRQIKRVVLAYSGGLDTSVILRWLKEAYGCEVIAFCADVGQGDELSEVKEKAFRTGADHVVVEDLKEEFVRNYVFPAFRANAIYESTYLLGTSIARPCIAKAQVEVAERFQADAVCHGATGKGNDQVRFELTYMALAPHLRIIAPWREWSFKGRSDLMEYAKNTGIPVPVTKERPYSMDRNLLHISYEGGILEDPWMEPPEEMFLLTTSPERAPDRPTYIEIGFEKGDPVTIDGQRLSPASLLERLNQIAGENGIGRVDVVENRYVGMKSRGVYETPGGTVLRVAHIALESITLDRELMHLRDALIPKYSEMIYYGYWFSPEREALQALIDKSQERVTGTVRLKLYKGNSIVVGRSSPYSLYDERLASFEAEEVYDQGLATGFIRLNGLRLRTRHHMERRQGDGP